MSSPGDSDCAAERLAQARARLGTSVQGKWKLKELLGIGGTSAVYAATHRNGARHAIKIMHAEFTSDPKRCVRFQREGYAANLVRHPGVVLIHDDGVDDLGQPFLVMELLRGASLQALLSASAVGLPATVVLGWAVALLEILDAAHRRSVLHRDIKPSNLFLDEHGRLRVLDFGLAGGNAFESSIATASGSILGTPAFMPPEQARADWAAVDARSDIWATGATLFTLLTGEHVHPASTAQEQLGMAMMVSARSLRRVKPHVSERVAKVVDRALCFEPTERWQSAREMDEACRAVLRTASLKLVERRSPIRARDDDYLILTGEIVRPGAMSSDTQQRSTVSLDEHAGAPGVEMASKVRRKARHSRDVKLVLGLSSVLAVIALSAAKSPEGGVVQPDGSVPPKSFVEGVSKIPTATNRSPKPATSTEVKSALPAAPPAPSTTSSVRATRRSRSPSAATAQRESLAPAPADSGLARRPELEDRE